MSDERNICPFCGKDLDEEGLGYCDNCYLDLIAVISELSSLSYHIENSVKDRSDKEILEELKQLNKNLSDEIFHLSQKLKDEVKYE